jgi:hypothetical protein
LLQEKEIVGNISTTLCSCKKYTEKLQRKNICPETYKIKSGSIQKPSGGATLF